jgi:hypothetical protein
MAKVRLCPECGVPRHVSNQIIWRSNGTMVQRRNPDHRSVLMESEDIDGVYHELEKIIAHPIEHIIIESRRRSSADYLEKIVPGVLRKAFRVIGIKPVMNRINNIGKALGYGDIELVDLRWKRDEDDYLILRVREPYSLPLICGDVAGTIQVFDGRDVSVTYEGKAPLEYELAARIESHPPELRERLAWRDYTYKDGDIELERCSHCGVPKAVQEFEFNAQKGIMLYKRSGRRMVGIGPAALEAISDELERELGENIPEAIIEAQRRFVTGGFYSKGEIESEEDFRLQFAFRGWGNLKELDFSAESLRCRLENPCLHLLIVGLLLGFFELVYERPGEVDWKLKEDGDLLVVVSPRSRGITSGERVE